MGEGCKQLINTYKLNNSSSILDIGCIKGICYEIKKILPKGKILELIDLDMQYKILSLK